MTPELKALVARGNATAAIELLEGALKLITTAGTCSPKPPGHSHAAEINRKILQWQSELLRYTS